LSSVVVPSIISAVLEESIKRIARKVTEGKKLTDSEVMILILDQVNRRIEVGFNNVDKRFGDIDKRFNDIDKRFEDMKEYVDRRFNDLKEYVDKRFDNVNKRIDDLNATVRMLVSEVSSIKSDVITLLKERLERER